MTRLSALAIAGMLAVAVAFRTTAVGTVAAHVIQAAPAQAAPAQAAPVPAAPAQAAPPQAPAQAAPAQGATAQIPGSRLIYVRVEQSIVEHRLANLPAGDAGRLDLLRKQFAVAGAQEQQVVTQVLPSAGANLLCRLPGSGPGTILVAARLDDPEKQGAQKGAAARVHWASLAMLPLLYESLSGMATQSTYVFAAFTGGAHGDAGAAYYLSSLSEAERKGIRAVIEVEDVGRTSLAYRVAKGGEGLGTALVKAAFVVHAYEPVPLEDGRFVAAKSLERLGVPALTAFSPSWIDRRPLENIGVVHTPVEELNPTSYYAAYQTLAVFLRYIDTGIPAPEKNAAGEPRNLAPSPIRRGRR